MEEKVSLALAVKLKKLFEDREDQFLTFSPGAAYSYRDLDFMNEQSDLSAQERLRLKASFARLMNAIPIDRAAYLSDVGRMLWNETKDILIRAEFAKSTLSPSEEKQLAEAIDFLTDEKVEEGDLVISVPSPQYEAYKTYRDLYYTAEKTYQNEESAVEYAAGEEGKRLKKIWESGREQELRRLKDNAWNEWVNLGFKNQVETYQNVQNTLELKRSPILYRQDYLDEIDVAEVADIDAQGIVFCVTFFSPSNAFDPQLPWSKVTLVKEEIQNLIRQAPSELKGMFTATHGNDDIESLSLEYRFVDVIRPWYRPEFFSSRYWRMPGDIVVCDGAVPRQGKIPAYITGLLAVRNVTVSKNRSAPTKENILPILNAVPLQKLRPMTRSSPTPAVARVVRAPTARLARPVAIADHRSGTKPAPKPARITIRPAGKSTFTAGRILATPRRVDPKKAPVIVARNKTAFVRAKYTGMTVKARPIKPALVALSPMNKPSPEKARKTVTETHNFDGITVLAYVCRRLPKSPNPDSSLQW